MMQQTEIKFGTDGWRALIAEDFTFANVARCARGMSDFLKERGTAERGLVVGYDTRFLSKEFAATVAGVCAGQGIRIKLSKTSTPTPVLSYNVLHQGTVAQLSSQRAIIPPHGTASSSSQNTPEAPRRR